MKVARIQLGDWVSGTSVNDERVRGFVEEFSRQHGFAWIRVTQSDREASIGNVVETSLAKLEKLSDEGWQDEFALYDLIDLALATRDEQWFMELTSSLTDFRSQPNKAVSAFVVPNKNQHNRRIWTD